MIKRELKCHGDGTINWFKPRCIWLHKLEENDDSNQSGDMVVEDGKISNKGNTDNQSQDKLLVEKLVPSYKLDSNNCVGESDSHACVVHDGIVYFWGGRNETYGKIHRFDMATYCWLTPVSEYIPKMESRYYHSFIKQGNEPIFWMFGGLSDTEEPTYYNDLITVDATNFKWDHLQPNGTWPEVRRGHVFLYRESNHSLLLFGGCGSDVFSDLWEFNIRKRRWNLLHTKNEIPPRGYSSGVIMKKDGVETLVVFGGDIGVSNQTLSNELCLLNMNTMVWTTLNNSITPPLFGHACTTCKISNDEMFIYGGCNDDYIPYSESYIYNLKYNTWTEIKVDNILPLNCSSIFIDEERGLINVYGGYDHVRRTDTHILIQINSMYDYTIFRNFPKLSSSLNRSTFSDVQIEFTL